MVMRHDLLTEPVIPIRRADGSRSNLSLPSVLAELSAGDGIASFDRLKAHQDPAWLLFLVQVAAQALHHGGKNANQPPDVADTWQELLANLTPGQADTAWALVVDDPTQPALLQPPVRADKAWAKYKETAVTADGLDILVAAKNHDLKAAREHAAHPVQWLYALLNKQTFGGYEGAGLYGVSRMNGGFGSRVCVELTPELGWGARFRQNLGDALARRQAILANLPAYFRDDAQARGLLWLLPWDEEDSLPLADLDPLFVEICRRLRLVSGRDGRIAALQRPSKVPRLAHKHAAGHVGDPWLPISAKTGEALTIGPTGVTTRRLFDLVAHPDLTPPPYSVLAGRQEDAETDLLLQVQVLVRGQGETKGFYRRQLTVPARPRDMMADPSQRQELYQLGRDLLNAQNEVQKALAVALAVLNQDGPDRLSLPDDVAYRRAGELEGVVEREFFDFLWPLVAADEDRRPAVEARWQARVVEAAEAILAHYMGPAGGTVRHYRAAAQAANGFWATIYKRLPAFRRAGAPADLEAQP